MQILSTNLCRYCFQIFLIGGEAERDERERVAERDELGREKEWQRGMN